jgi:hypothetical protein
MTVGKVEYSPDYKSAQETFEANMKVFAEKAQLWDAVINAAKGYYKHPGAGHAERTLMNAVAELIEFEQEQKS